MASQYRVSTEANLGPIDFWASHAVRSNGAEGRDQQVLLRHAIHNLLGGTRAGGQEVTQAHLQAVSRSLVAGFLV